MIQPNELRLGNLIIDEHGREVTVTSITAGLSGGVINNDHDTVTTNSNEYSPITITQQWLLNLGFYESYKDTYEISIGHLILLRIMIHDKGWWKIIEHNSSGNRTGINLGDIYFIHQVQNLYHSLTSEELTLKQIQ